MPFTYTATITDENDEIPELINTAVDSATASLSTKVQTLRNQVSDLETRVAELEHSTPTEPIPTPTDPTPEPEPEPEPEPTTPEGPRVISYDARHTTNGMTLSAVVSDVAGDVTLRASANPLTGQTGWYMNGTPNSEGSVNIALTAFTNADARYWQLEEGAGDSGYGTVLVSGKVEPSSTPSPTPEPTPSGSGVYTGGSGGPLTARLNQDFYNTAGTYSQYHVFADGLDWTKDVGAMIYGDGSGAYGWKNPSSTYLIAGTNGLRAVAKRLNMVLIMPLAPLPGCPTDNCWYDDGSAWKARWAADLVLSIYKQYNIDKSRVVMAGYSSGAELSSRYLFPAHAGELMTGGVVIPISYGGRPYSNINMPASLKNTVVLSWDCGGDDASALSATRSGESWYSSQGWETQLNVVPGLGHGRSGQFGGIVEREAREHLRSV